MIAEVTKTQFGILQKEKWYLIDFFKASNQVLLKNNAIPAQQMNGHDSQVCPTFRKHNV